MKVIDLLNKIANGEEVPKTIRIRGVFHPDWDENDKPIDVEDMTIWYLDDSYFNYDYYSKGEIGERKNMFEIYLINRILNNEIEIIDYINGSEKRVTKEDVLKLIDGRTYYYTDYIYFLYEQLEIKDLILKALHKYFKEHEQYEDNEFLRQLESCTEKDMEWLKKMAGSDKE